MKMILGFVSTLLVNSIVVAATTECVLERPLNIGTRDPRRPYEERKMLILDEAEFHEPEAFTSQIFKKEQPIEIRFFAVHTAAEWSGPYQLTDFLGVSAQQGDSLGFGSAVRYINTSLSGHHKVTDDESEFVLREGEQNRNGIRVVLRDTDLVSLELTKTYYVSSARRNVTYRLCLKNARVKQFMTD